MRSERGDHTRFSAGFSKPVVIIDTSEIADDADYGGMLYELKRIGITDGEVYQVDNAGDLLMYASAYDQCRQILAGFGAKAVSL